MPWFLIGDQMHSAPMLRKITAIEPAAVGLWAVAGSWSSEHLTDGFIPDDDLPWLFPDALKLAQALVVAGAWKRARNGHKFVPDGVTHRIPTKDAVEADRSSAAERQRRSRERKVSRRDSHVTNDVTNGVSHRAQSNPSQSVVDLIDHLAGGYALAPDDDPILRSVIDSISRRTGSVIAAASARSIAAAIIGARSVKDPAAYVAKAIAAEPDPRGRWLAGPVAPAALPSPWCGTCDEQTRLTDPDSPRRCPKCHPLRDES